MKLLPIPDDLLTQVNKTAIRKSYKTTNNATTDLTHYAGRPVEFTHEVLEVPHITSEQRELLESIRDNRTTNAQAGNSVGKTFILACAVLYWVFALQGLCFTTAPSLQQTKDLLWREIRILYDRHKHKLGGSRGELSVKLSEEAKAVGFTARHNDPASWQGKHALLLLLIQDEADGISPAIDEAFESCLTGSSNRGVRIGNPIDPSSSFAKACAIAHIKISAWSHPNVAWAYQLDPDGIHRLKPEVAALILKPIEQRKDDPVKPQDEWPEHLPRDVIPGAVSIRWIEMVRIKYGEKSAYWISRVEAKFPSDSADGFIPLSWLLEARTRFDSNPEYWDYQASLYLWRVGIDVSDGGDNHCIAIWKGPVLYSVEIIAPLNDRQDTLRLAKIAADKLKNLGGDILCAVDNTGVGAGTLAKLLELGWHAVGCKFGESAEERGEFTNRKAELYWQFRDKLRLGEYAIAPLSNQDYVFQDLSATRYITDTKDKIGCEPKSKTIARLKRSPDSEAAVIALENGMGLMVQPTHQTLSNTEEYLPSRYYEDGSIAKLKREFRV